jgi:hypothetical protein
MIPFAVLATIGTLAGALFSHYLLFPSVMAFFGTFDSPRVRFMPRLQDTFELYRNMLLGQDRSCSMNYLRLAKYATKSPSSCCDRSLSSPDGISEVGEGSIFSIWSRGTPIGGPVTWVT